MPADAQDLILVVDDAPANIHVAVEILRVRYKTLAATNGSKAILLAHSEPRPNLILLDVSMPEMDGYEVCRKLKADTTTCDIPVIFLTSKTEAEDETTGFQVGAVDYIHKPFSPSIVLARVNTHLTLRAAREQLAQEKRLVDRLLDNMLPTAAVAELKATGRVAPKRFERVAVLFIDLVNFTGFCNEHSPEEVVTNLADLFELFEACAQRHGLEKIKSIGDALMATAGLLLASADPLQASVNCALEMIMAAPQRGWQVRSGICVGPLMAGIVGRERYQFDIWGDTVNVAARLASAAAAGSVALLQEQGALLRGYAINPRGQVDLKGKGPVPLVEISPQGIPR